MKEENWALAIGAMLTVIVALVSAFVLIGGPNSTEGPRFQNPGLIIMCLVSVLWAALYLSEHDFK